MKAGDKLYCIKNSYDHTGLIAHISGNIYAIQEISNYPRMPNLPGVDMITSVLLECGHGYYGYYTLNGGNEFDIYNYFIDIKESRKFKLEKLNIINKI